MSLSRRYFVLVQTKAGRFWPSCGGRLTGVQFYDRHENATRESERLRAFSEQQTSTWDNFTTERQVKRFCRLLNEGVGAVEAVRLTLPPTNRLKGTS